VILVKIFYWKYFSFRWSNKYSHFYIGAAYFKRLLFALWNLVACCCLSF